MKLNEFFLKIKDKMLISTKNKKMTKIVISFLFLLIVICLFLPSFSLTKKEEQKSDDKVISISEYSSSIENKLSQMLNSLDEISKVSVMVMVESTPKIEYLTEFEESTQTNEKGELTTKSSTVVFSKDGSVSTPITITTIMPKVCGVLIITNKINPATKLNIIKSVSIVLNIDESSISILQES